jgi:hypothetical protein
MTNELIERSRKREFADVALIVTTVALVVSLVIAFTAVSIGIARADTLAPFTDGSGGCLVFSLSVGLAIAGIGVAAAALVHKKMSRA